MPNIGTCVALNTTLSSSNSYIKNMDDYAFYLSEIIRGRVNKPRRVHLISDLFGELDITIQENKFSCISDKGKFNIYVNIEYSSVDEDTIVDTFNKDRKLLSAIGNEISAFVKDLNPALRDIQIIKNENVIFENERFYIEVSPLNSKHETEWISFEIDEDFYDTEQLGDNM